MIQSIKEQISEEFADKLLEDYFFGDKPDFRSCKKEMKQRWKKQGYIKQSREEEIRELIKEEKTAKYPINYEHFYREAVELIEILDNKERNK